MYLPQNSKATEEVGYQSSRHCKNFLFGNGVGFQPLGKLEHSDRKVSVSPVALWEGSRYVDGYSSNVVLLHLPQIPGSGT
jgi:hypothetical protein